MSHIVDTTSHAGAERTEQITPASADPSRQRSPPVSLFAPNSPVTIVNDLPVTGIHSKASTENLAASAPRTPDSSDLTGQVTALREDVTTLQANANFLIMATKLLLKAAQFQALQCGTLGSSVRRETADEEMENGELKREVADVKRQIGELRRENSELRRENGELRRQNGELRREVAGARREVAGANREISDLKREVVDARKEVVEPKAPIDRLDKDNQRPSLSLLDAQEDIVRLISRYTAQVDGPDQLVRMAREIERLCCDRSVVEARSTGLF